MKYMFITIVNFMINEIIKQINSIKINKIIDKKYIDYIL
jgi:hypothetical protein